MTTLLFVGHRRLTIYIYSGTHSGSCAQARDSVAEEKDGKAESALSLSLAAVLLTLIQAYSAGNPGISL